ncbi:hypothetical protein ACSW8S_18870 (plasmid) [Clostridium perfringens]
MAKNNFNESYFNTETLNRLLNVPNSAKGLWSIKTSRLKEVLGAQFNNTIGKEINILKDKAIEKSESGSVLYRGVYVVISDEVIDEFDMKLLLSDYVKRNPTINRNISNDAYSDKKVDSINETTKPFEVNGGVYRDLNEAAKNIDADNLIFGVIDDPNHINVVSKIEGVEIIENVGDFKKVYFSVPSYKQCEVLAHSVTILPCVKCKRALLDFII